MSHAAIPVLVGGMLLTGCANTLLTKYQDMQCVAECNTDQPKLFEQPVIQTLQMFVGETGCWLVVLVTFIFRSVLKRRTDTRDDATYRPLLSDTEIDEPAEIGELNLSSEPEVPSSQTLVDATNLPIKPLIDGEQTQKSREPLTGGKITLLALPAVCDIIGTTLLNVGLLFLAASIYQMLRGTLILFVGLFSVMFLKRYMGLWKWASLFVVVLGVAIVGLAGALEHEPSQHEPEHGPSIASFLLTPFAVGEEIRSTEAHTAAQTVLGLLIIVVAQVFAASQFVLEENIMERYAMEPIQVVGWEGAFGFLITLVGMGVMHALVGRTEHGKGGFFDVREGFSNVFHHRDIGISSLLIMLSIGGFNFFGLSVTRSLSATSRSTIDTCRTLFIWIVSLGLGWESFKWLQVLGFVLLVYGTFLFNEIVRPPTVALLRWRSAESSSPQEERTA